MFLPPIQEFFCIPASAAYAAAINLNSIKTILANVLCEIFIRGKPVFSNGPRILHRNPPEYTILDSWLFYIFALTDELFAKALWRF